jgi:hypothetical protein
MTRRPAEPPPAGPPSGELAGALAANAARKPFNLLALVVTLAAAWALGAPLVVALLLAMVVYAGAAARTMFDAAETERVTASLTGGSERQP